MASTPQLLAGKATAITGGVTGIGRAIALGFVAHGANVAINHFGDAKSASQFQTLLAEAASILGGPEEAARRVAEVPGDVGDPETGRRLVREVVGRWGRLDVIVSNAGICEFRSFWSISSISALVGGAQQAHYTPTKSGVLSLIQSSACALGQYNIRCNALLPGTIKTQLNEKDLENEEKRKYMEGRIPLGRTGVVGDLVGPAVFLASEALSGYVTGRSCWLMGVVCKFAVRWERGGE
ncbi:hypothetical protein N0V90_009415 [Kalmusia sp. IMI 367209]|nr:hypothetical protein N0V90_009415 [Kalmusia sp. IMI 367209]